MAPTRGCWFPDAILHGKRSFRPRSRAVQCLAATEFRVRLFSSLRLVVAPPACEPGQDTPVIFSSRLNHWLRVSHRFWRCVRPQPRVSPLLSQAAFFSQSSGAVFSIAGLGSFSRGLPSRRLLPDTSTLFVCLSAFLIWRIQLFIFEPPESPIPC